MKRWNGWGETGTEMHLPAGAQKLLAERIGPAQAVESVPRQKLIANVPPARVDESHELISTDAGQRLDFAHGQSLPDWVAMRFGTLERFPDAVACPASDSQLEDVLDFADRHQLAVIACGGATSVVGHLQVPEGPAPVLTVCMQRLNRLIDFDPDSRLAGFGAGVRGPDLEAALRADGYTLGHYPQSFEYSTLGGWVATRSSGQQSLYYGRIEDLFAGGRVIAPCGKIEFPPFPASAAGPDLRQVFLGSEGRLGILSRAWVRVRRRPEADEIYGVFFPGWDAARSAVREIAATDLPLSMLRLSNPAETETNLLLAGRENQIALLKKYLRLRGLRDPAWCMLLAGLTGSRKHVAFAKKIAKRIIRKHGGVAVGKPMGEAWKKNRFLAPYLRNTLWDRGYAVDTLETAVTWERVDSAMEAVEAAIAGAAAEKKEKVHVFSHLSHVYRTGSSIYTTYLFRVGQNAAQVLELWQAMKKAASLAIVSEGGTISHQHGVGMDHKAYLPAEKGDCGMGMIRSLGAHADPHRRMNPGKLFDAGEDANGS